MSERVAIISDTHGYLDERIAVVVEACDHVLHAGDVGSKSVADALKQRGECVMVRGNNDVPAKWAPAEVAFMLQLPLEGALSLPGGVVKVVHGDRSGQPKFRHQWLRRHYADARMVVYGHSHHLCVDQDERPWVVNPGASGRNRTFGGPSYLILTASARRWSVRAYRLPKL